MIGILMEKVTKEIILLGLSSFVGTFGALAAEKLLNSFGRPDDMGGEPMYVGEEPQKGVTVVNNINVGIPNDGPAQIIIQDEDEDDRR